MVITVGIFRRRSRICWRRTNENRGKEGEIKYFKMIVGSFNIMGSGSSINHKRISLIINRGEADMFLVQEMKLEDVSIEMTRKF